MLSVDFVFSAADPTASAGDQPSGQRSRVLVGSFNIDQADGVYSDLGQVDPLLSVSVFFVCVGLDVSLFTSYVSLSGRLSQQFWVHLGSLIQKVVMVWKELMLW